MTPEGWTAKRLGDVVRVQTGYPFKSADFAPSGIPIVRMSNLKSGRLDLTGAAMVPDATVTGLDSFRLMDGDLLLGLSGSIENFAVVRERDRPCYLNQRVGRFLGSHCESLHYPLLTQIIQSDRFRLLVAGMAAGGAQLNVSPKQIESISIPLPPLPEQRKIADILTSVDWAIEGAQAVIGQLQVVKKAMMAELLTRGIPGRHTKFKQTEIGEVPDEWEVEQGDDLFSLSGGYGPSDMTFEAAGVALFLKVDDFNRPTNRRGLRDAALRYNPEENPRIRTCVSGHLVFPKRGAAIFKNRVQVLKMPATVDPNLMVLAPGDRLDPEFFAYSMLHIGLHNLSDNSGIPQINNKHLYPHFFAVPSLSEQHKIREALAAVDDRLDAELVALEATTALKSSLMSVLLNGEVRVQPAEDAA